MSKEGQLVAGLFWMNYPLSIGDNGTLTSLNSEVLSVANITFSADLKCQRRGSGGRECSSSKTTLKITTVLTLHISFNKENLV